MCASPLFIGGRGGGDGGGFAGFAGYGGKGETVWLQVYKFMCTLSTYIHVIMIEEQILKQKGAPHVQPISDILIKICERVYLYA